MLSNTAKSDWMQKILFAILLCYVAVFCSAQIVLDRQVIAPFAMNQCGTFCISSSAGQIETNTYQNEHSVVTSGFEQPVGELSMLVQLKIVYNTCTKFYQAEIISISGCTTIDSITVFWNNLPGSLINNVLPMHTTLDIVANNGCGYHAEYDFNLMDLEKVGCDLIFYNYLSPNGDGDNDNWRIENIELGRYADNTIVFLNRWGMSVWETKGYDNITNSWTGLNSNGEQLPDGTYYYKMNANGFHYSGYVELMR